MTCSTIPSNRMARRDYKTCRNCHRHASEVGPLSHSRLCVDCFPIIRDENNISIHLKTGPGHTRRLYGIAMKEFGPRVALALKQSGVFDALDTTATTSNAGS